MDRVPMFFLQDSKKPPVAGFQRVSYWTPVLTLLFLLIGPGPAWPAEGSTPEAASQIAPAPPGEAGEQWFSRDPKGDLRVRLYLFWSQTCPHCLEAKPVVEAMAARLPWIDLHLLEIKGSEENRRRFAEMAAPFGAEPRSVPTFFFCNAMMSGFDGEGRIARFIESKLAECRDRLAAGQGLPEQLTPGKATAELVTGFDTRDMSLQLLTLVIAGLDAFNPCAFFVLLSLLSLLVHARSRRRMLFVGGVFVLFSGLIYFLFMAAWLNFFLIAEEVRWVTLAAGLVAVTFALFNIKDYFLLGVGPSLSIPESAKPGLFQRMRGLLQTDNLPTLVAGTVVLAVAVNSYELLCTSGLPMVYTRLLTLERLPIPVYYAYLVAYNLIYVLPLLAIVLVFTFTLGARKLQAREARLLKLLSGLMMLGLGLVLVLAPAWLNNLWITFGLIGIALAVTALLWRLGNSGSGAI